jgi:hypothetical protein
VEGDSADQAGVRVEGELGLIRVLSRRVQVEVDSGDFFVAIGFAEEIEFDFGGEVVVVLVVEVGHVELRVGVSEVELDLLHPIIALLLNLVHLEVEVSRPDVVLAVHHEGLGLLHR